MLEQLGDLVMGGGAGAGLLGTVLMLRRRLSRDSTEMTKDRAEAHIIQTALLERDAARAEARAAWAEHQADAEAIARLTAQNVHQAKEIERLTAEFRAFKRMLARVFPETREFLISDFQPLTP
jgi:hypothetical protein